MEVGKIIHFFDKINVAVVDVLNPIKIGDKIRIKGTTTDFKQTVNSMQIDRTSIKEARKGDAIGLKVKEKVRIGDKVIKE